MKNGFKGKILRVNLTKEKFSYETLEETFYRRYFGGRGLISYYLLNELEPKINPLSFKNKLIFCLPGSPNAVKLAMERLILHEAGHILKHIRNL